MNGLNEFPTEENAMNEPYLYYGPFLPTRLRPRSLICLDLYPLQQRVICQPLMQNITTMYRLSVFLILQNYLKALKIT